MKVLVMKVLVVKVLVVKNFGCEVQAAQAARAGLSDAR
jgi:hypothetical protein